MGFVFIFPYKISHLCSRFGGKKTRQILFQDHLQETYFRAIVLLMKVDKQIIFSQYPHKKIQFFAYGSHSIPSDNKTYFMTMGKCQTTFVLCKGRTIVKWILNYFPYFQVHFSFQFPLHMLTLSDPVNFLSLYEERSPHFLCSLRQYIT